MRTFKNHVMNQIIFFFLLYIQFINPNGEKLIGKWDLVSSGTIESLKNSDGYLLADFNTQSLADEMFQLALDSIYYDFRIDTLIYQDLVGPNGQMPAKTITRKAIWALHGDTLMVKELERNFFREYVVKTIGQDSLSLYPIIDNKANLKGGYDFIRVSMSK